MCLRQNGDLRAWSLKIKGMIEGEIRRDAAKPGKYVE